MQRCAINKGEAVVTFDLSFKGFGLVLDFKYFNCYRANIDNYTRVLLQRNGPISKPLAFVAHFALE
jgi:hypothetical protein